MKIEKINDNQIRCTLTSEDLASRQIRLTELAYGTEKAKNLFRDMMQQAQFEFGFDADNIPLMIEAIPVNPDSIVLIITKVEDPEELDTRFSKFSPGNDAANEPSEEVHLEGADDIIDIFHKIYEAKSKALAKKKSQDSPSEESVETVDEDVPVNLIRLYRFGYIDSIIDATIALNHYYTGSNTLYKESQTGDYLLVIHQSPHTPEEFNKVCNILSEYGQGQSYSSASEAYLQEHQEIILEGNALQKLATLK
ncbi:MAG: adaptor protein MecA [Lachnospiraceae bacterium]|nr:adaptor protein MecA [Lachnospiraceae bacterium]